MRLWFLFMHLSLVPHCTLLIDLNLEVLARLEWVLQSAVGFVGRIPIKDDNSNNNNNLSFSSVLDTCDLLHWLHIYLHRCFAAFLAVLRLSSGASPLMLQRVWCFALLQGVGLDSKGSFGYLAVPCSFGCRPFNLKWSPT